VWEAFSRKIDNDQIAALQGFPEYNREGKLCFQVESVLDMNQLAERPLSEVHIRLATKALVREETLLPLKDCISSHGGNCTVYFHLPRECGEVVIKTTSSLRTSGQDIHINELKDAACVDEVWTE
jgi:hypothetical protein